MLKRTLVFRYAFIINAVCPHSNLQIFTYSFFTFHGLLLLHLITASPQLEEKQQSLSSIEAKLRESEKNLGESNKEKDITIRSLQEQVHISESVTRWLSVYCVVLYLDSPSFLTLHEKMREPDKTIM